MTTEKQAINATAAAAPGAWELRVKAAMEAGQQPSYGDLEEGIEDLLQKNAVLFQQNHVLNEFSRDAQVLIAQMVIAHHFSNTEKVLSLLDEFMTTRVIIKTEAQKTH